MATFFLAFSAFVFIATYLFHGAHVKGDRGLLYMDKPYYKIVIFLDGYIIPIILITMITGFHWAIVSIIYYVFLLLFYHFLSRLILYMCEKSSPYPWENFNDYRLSNAIGILLFFIGFLI